MALIGLSVCLILNVAAVCIATAGRFLTILGTVANLTNVNDQKALT